MALVIYRLREHAKEITKDFERRGYTREEAKLMVRVLDDEVSKCLNEVEKQRFKALE